MSKIFLIKAEESLQATKTLLENELYNDAVSRAYYACFQIACVALHQYDMINIDDVRKYNHKAIKSSFSRIFKEKRIYPIEIKGCLEELLIVRMIADYEPHIIISAEKAKKHIEQAIYFFEIVKKSLKEGQ